ncbi:sel1 repeat family protein [Deefgea tanakiae]|uniref:Sel1 repeat family protein n=1 Tax=Deefgea tanakiae TaxID=2865840 RepID=A0ABX8Z7X6_9NEIS|nr:tetratricopeptide repeat protein [Deefgea tanakiae]QZA78678.1 sel1 repeat family protein [Deefgea tanakiae]
MKKRILAILITVFTTTSHAGFDEGVAAHKAGNYQLAFKEYEPLAKQGDAQAQNNLAELIVYTPKGDKYGHILPNFVAYDPVRAFDLFRKAAKQGNADAQFNLGRFYMRGEPVSSRSTGSRDLLPDYAQAISWLSKAAEQGHTKALRQLGALYYNGKEVTPDYAQALSWFIKAAERGDAEAKVTLGAMYYNGKGVPQDYVQAMSWWNKAAEQGNADAQFNLGAMYFNGQGVTQDYSQAVSWYSKAATSTDPKISANAKKYLVLAQDKISVISEKPQKIEKKDQQLLVIDSNKGSSLKPTHPDAKVMREFRKLTAGSCKKIMEKQIFSLASKGDSDAQFCLALAYSNANYPNPTVEYTKQEIYWLWKSAEQGNAYALRNLGGIYELGSGVPATPINPAIAYAFYNLAALADPSVNTRDYYKKEISRADIKAGNLLAEEMKKPNNLFNAVDRFLRE